MFWRKIFDKKVRPEVSFGPLASTRLAKLEDPMSKARPMIPRMPFLKMALKFVAFVAFKKAVKHC